MTTRPSDRVSGGITGLPEYQNSAGPVGEPTSGLIPEVVDPVQNMIQQITQGFAEALKAAGLTGQSTLAAVGPLPQAQGTGGGGGGGGSGGGTTTTTSGGGGDDSTAAPEPVSLNLEGGTLVKVSEAAGYRYYLEYEVYGVPIRYEIGDQTAYDELGPQDWPSVITVTEQQFNNREGLDVGLVDERFGITESVQGTFDRQLRTFAKEDIPGWQRRSKEVMTILLTGANEGWSAGRIYNEVSRTDAFTRQFPGFEEVRKNLGNTTIQETLTWYTAARDQVKQSLNDWRGESTVSNQKIGQLLAKGWDPDELDRVLKAEARLRAMPGAADQINALLEFQGRTERVNNNNLIRYILGETDESTPPELLEVVNDALRSQAFANQGIDLSPALAAALGTGESFDTLDIGTLTQVATETAQNIFRFGLELEAEREGLTRDQLIVAAVNGDNAAGVFEKLAKFARRRQIEAGGMTASSSYQDNAGQLRLLGTTGL